MSMPWQQHSIPLGTSQTSRSALQSVLYDYENSAQLMLTKIQADTSLLTHLNLQTQAKCQLLPDGKNYVTGL